MPRRTPGRARSRSSRKTLVSNSSRLSALGSRLSAVGAVLVRIQITGVTNEQALDSTRVCPSSSVGVPQDRISRGSRGAYVGRGPLGAARHRRAFAASAGLREKSTSLSSKSAKPKIAVIGVRISWLMLAKNSLLDRQDDSACSFAASRILFDANCSEMSRTTAK